jgi:hypothetical protein
MPKVVVTANNGLNDTRNSGHAKALLRSLLGALSFSGNVGKHSLECFASGRIGVFVRRVLRLGLFVVSGRLGVGWFHFLGNHHSTNLSTNTSRLSH